MTQRVLRLWELVAMRDMPPAYFWPSGRFFEDAQFDALGLTAMWIFVCIALFLIVIVFAALYSAVVGTPSDTLITLLLAPPVFTAAGVFLQGLRAEAATIIIRFIGRGDEREPNLLVAWLLAPRDTDLLIQFTVAALYVVANV